MGPKNSEIKLFWEQFHRSPLVKSMAVLLVVVLTVVFTGKEFSLSRAISDLNYDSAPTKAKKPTKPAEKLHAAVVALQDLLAIQAKQSLTEKQAKRAASSRTEIVTQLRALEGQFATDRVKLWKLHAKDALKRLDVIEAKTAKLKKQLVTSLASVPSDGAKSTLAANTATKTLTALSPEKPQQPLSSDLSFGIKNAKPRSVSLSAGITPAYNSPTPQEAASPLPREPQPEDLQETPETRITPAIEQLATTLNHNPVKIYEYVRNNIRIETYYGIRKGADQTLAEKAGSDADQAALLIALLRESGIHARFVQGVAELPAAKAANWLGVDVAHGERIDAVPEILWSGGTPVNTTKVNGQLTKIRFNHIWAEAYVPQEAYRGVDEGSTQKSWSPLDASIKSTSFVQPSASMRDAMFSSSGTWLEDYGNEATFLDANGNAAPGLTFDNAAGILAPPRSSVEQINGDLSADLSSLIDDIDLAHTRLVDLVGGRFIVEQEAHYIPNSLPFVSRAISDEFQRVPNSLSASVSISIRGEGPYGLPDDIEDASNEDIDYMFNTSESPNSRLTISYVPATNEDEEVIDAYHGMLNAPTYAANLIPVIRMDGEIVARGHTPVSVGYAQELKVTYRAPGNAPSTNVNPVTVGSISALSVDLGYMSTRQISKRALALERITEHSTDADVLTDRIAGEKLALLGRQYFARNDMMNAIASQSMAVHAQRQLSGAVTATDIGVSYVGAFPVLASLDGVSIDVDEDAQSIISKRDFSTSLDEASAYLSTSGSNASMYEGLLFEQVYGAPAASTMSVLAPILQQPSPHRCESDPRT